MSPSLRSKYDYLVNINLKVQKNDCGREICFVHFNRHPFDYFVNK